MDVDVPTGSPKLGEENPLEQYGHVLEELSESPYDYGKHQEHLQLAHQLGPDAVYEARDLLARFFPLSSEQWLEWIGECQAQLSTPEQVHKTVALYQKSLSDLLSIPVCHSYASYALRGYYHSRGMQLPNSEDKEDAAVDEERDAGQPQANEELQQVWTEEYTREQLGIAAKRAQQHITEGHVVWNLLRDYEMHILNRDATPEQLERVKDLYIMRLSHPHRHMDTTFSDYSSFVSTYMEQRYESELVAANTVYGSAKSLWDFRETKELDLASAGFTPDAYISYAMWERTGKKAAQLNPMHAANIYERAVAHHRAEYSVWEAYQDFWRDLFASDNNDFSEDEITTGLLGVAERSVRHVPFVGDSWAALMRAQERAGLMEKVEGTFNRAIKSKLFEHSVDSIVKVYLARADFHRRVFETMLVSADEPPAYLVDVKTVVTEGSKAVKKAEKMGDPRMRLENYLTRFCGRFDQLDDAESVWKNAVGMYKGNEMAWLGYAELQMRRNDMEGARSVFERASKLHFQYPEYIFEAFIAFEHEYGSVEEFETTERQIRKQMKGVMNKRMRDAEKVPPPHSLSKTNSGAEASGKNKRPMDDALEPQAKRVRVQEPPDESSSMTAAVPTEIEISTALKPVDPPKRDREHASMMVSGLPPSAGESDLRKLFEDCGEIRQINIISRPEQTYATVEFMSRACVAVPSDPKPTDETLLQTSIPAARTKDKKRINGSELTVDLVWQTTLYVTNFPETVEDSKIKELFEPYGPVLDVRWPSKRFKSTRRFCYVQYANAASAQRSLELHNKELEPGMKLSVLVSDPDRKKERTDVNNNQKEVYVAGLARSTKEDDLHKLFSRYGKITGIRVMKDEDSGQCRGFAFVDFESEESAKGALALNSSEFKKRHITVTIADSRQAGTRARSQHTESNPQLKEAARARSIRVTNLPEDTQDGVLQQFFSQQGKVVKTFVNVPKKTATVEFESEADVGKALMLPEGSLDFNGSKLTVEPMSGTARSRANQNGAVANRSVEASSLMHSNEPVMMAPRIVRGRGRGRGGRGGRAGFSRS